MITNKMESIKLKIREARFCQTRSSGAKIKNSNLRLKSAGEPSQRASQTLLLPTGGGGGIRTHVRLLPIGFQDQRLTATWLPHQ